MEEAEQVILKPVGISWVPFKKIYKGSGASFATITKLTWLFYHLSGSWSHPPPHCIPIRCRALEILDAHLRVLSLNNSFQGSATFLCPFGYKLVGQEEIKCGPGGAWTGVVPKCAGKH